MTLTSLLNQINHNYGSQITFHLMNHKKNNLDARADSQGRSSDDPFGDGHLITDRIYSIRYVRFICYKKPGGELDVDLDLPWENF